MPVGVRLFGTPAVQGEGGWHAPVTARPAALLYYLAFRQDWVERGALAALFWPDLPEARARGNLRKLLARTRTPAGAPLLEVERTRLRWRVETDVAAFRRALAARELEAAVRLYRGELLEGFRLPDALEFESWLEEARSDLRRAWRAAVLTAAPDPPLWPHLAGTSRARALVGSCSPRGRPPRSWAASASGVSSKRTSATPPAASSPW